MVGMVLLLSRLVKDGDLLLLIERMLHLRCLDTARITKVKGHAVEGMVLDGRVKEVDRLGNDAADEAADFVRRRVVNAVIDARRNLSGVCGRWYHLLFLISIDFSLPFLVQLSIMMIEMVLLPILWFCLLAPSPHECVGWFRRLGIGHFCPVRLVFGIRNGFMCLASAEGIAHWPNTPGLLVKWVSFFGKSPLACWWFGSWGWWYFLWRIAHPS